MPPNGASISFYSGLWTDSAVKECSKRFSISKDSRSRGRLVQFEGRVPSKRGMFREAVLSILATIAKQERIRLSERVKSGLTAQDQRENRWEDRPQSLIETGLWRFGKRGFRSGRLESVSESRSPRSAESWIQWRWPHDATTR